MVEFRLRFFGGLGLMLGDQDLTRPLSVKAQGLICYLASTGRPQSRLKLAGMFWGENPESDALRSLRVDLTKMRKHVAPYIEATRQTLAFKDSSSHWIDSETFDHHLRLVQHADGAAARTHLREAIQLYTGDFLDGYQAGDAYGFEEWVSIERESYQARALAAIEKLIEIHIDYQEYEPAIDCANQILQIDPWREKAHRSLMWLYMQSGQRGAALRQYDNCRSILADEVGVEPEPQTVQLWQQIKEQEGAVMVTTQPLPFPKAEVAEKRPFQAPPLIPFFSGRDDELAQLMAKIKQSQDVQVICMAGMGGVGKTSLAVQFAHTNQDYFEDGVLWANAGSDPATIAERWAVAYGYDFREISRVEDRLLAVREMLAEKQALIVVDNVTVAARVKPLLPAQGRSAVLVTTRNADIAYVLGAELLNLDVLTLANGRSLLSNIIGRSRVQDEQIAADAICQALQNLPLALAIAGQYLVSRPRRRLATFLDRLQRSALFDVADNEGVVRTSFDISWTALDKVQQRVFALVAVFNGRSFTAEAMAHIGERDFYLMQDHLDNLVARSLLIEQGSDYYRQHALLADFADEKLLDRQPALRRLINYYAKFTDAYGTAYAKLDEEWDNIDASLQIMAAETVWQTLFRVNQNLNQAWFAQGLFARAQQAHQLAHEGALAVADKPQIGESLYRQGMALLEQGQYDQAHLLFEQALAIFRELGDKVAISDIEYDMARIHIFQARYDQATACLEHGLSVKQTLNDRQSIGQFKYRQAVLFLRLSQYEDVLHIGQEIVALQEQAGNPLDLARTLRIMVWAHCQTPDFEEAQSCGERALALAEELGDQGEKAVTLSTLAEVSRRQKRFQTGLRQARESLAILEKMGDIASQASAMLRICKIYYDMQDYEAGVRYGKRALVLYEQVSDKLGQAWALGNMGIAYRGLGDLSKAQAHLLASRKIAEALDNEYWIRQVDEWLCSF